MNDESKHYNFFYEILEFIWNNLDENSKYAFKNRPSFWTILKSIFEL